MKRLILASRNRHKLNELRTFLRNIPLEVVAIDEVAPELALIEDGETFRENALRKARAVFKRTGELSLADDSGLEVFYLNGRPGVSSARYAGVGTTDENNNQKLLAEMQGVAPRRRGAQFHAVLALVGKNTEEFAEGICLGVLGEEPRGTNGFGYDPIFIPDGFTRTYAELSAEEKNQISHRSKAFAKMREILLRHLSSDVGV
ncbi:MAG: RdgB/HAM1 family non-canonical purine NTP pyrophosphatase [Ignavibacteriales bacterium]|nr:RdgB/HAM1 family non-canonical purine NTP pyrophosphatase [Ignavibacteriales bacterium]